MSWTSASTPTRWDQRHRCCARCASTDWSRYPGDDESPLRRALADLNGVSEHQVVLGNGSVDLMWWTLLAVIRPGDGVAVAKHTFGEYAHAARSVGAHVVDASDYARVLFVCQPNNPTGQYRPRENIEEILSQDSGRIIILDEAYATFVERRWPSEHLLAKNPNLVVLRSMTKDHALPGLRLGYLLASPTVAQAVATVRPPWSVERRCPARRPGGAPTGGAASCRTRQSSGCGVARVSDARIGTPGLLRHAVSRQLRAGRGRRRRRFSSLTAADGPGGARLHVVRTCPHASG